MAALSGCLFGISSASSLTFSLGSVGRFRTFICHQSTSQSASKLYQQSCDLSGRCRTRHSTLALVLSFGFSCTTHQYRLQTSFVALPFSPVFCLSMQKNLDGSSPVPDALNSTSVLGHTCHRSSSTSRILTTHICTRDLPTASELFTAGLFPCSSRMTTSGHFADTHGLTGYEPNLTNSQFMVAWAETQNLCGMQPGYGQILSITSRRSTRNFTEEANAHKYRRCIGRATCLLAGANLDTL